MKKACLVVDPVYQQNEIFKKDSWLNRDNWDLQNDLLFGNTFTCYDPMVDQRKYFKFNFSHHLSQQQKKEFLTFTQKSKFCTLIAGHKSVKHPQELYSKRVEAIRWFEKNQSEFFESSFVAQSVVRQIVSSNGTYEK